MYFDLATPMLVVLVPLDFILNVLLMVDVDVDAGPSDSIYRDFYSVPSHFLETVQLPIQQLMHCKICKRRIHHFSDARWIYRIKYTTYANTKQTKNISIETYVAPGLHKLWYPSIRDTST